jgi:GNAT superfamily N-acetyltransferase
MMAMVYNQTTGTPRRELKTKQGRNLEVRQILAADAALLVELFERLSPETRRLRFMRAIGDLPEGRIWNEARRLADIDPAREAALVATAREHGREQIVGVARLHCGDEQTCAEIALVVRDDYQREGVGRLLFGRLVDLARERGLRCLQAFTLAHNTAMRRLIDTSGQAYTSTTSRGETTITIQLGDSIEEMP